MSNKSVSQESQNSPEHHRNYFILRSQLVSAIFGSNSAHNGDKIYSILDSMRDLKDDSLATDFNHCEALVRQWKDTWYPDFID